MEMVGGESSAAKAEAASANREQNRMYRRVCLVIVLCFVDARFYTVGDLIQLLQYALAVF